MYIFVNVHICLNVYVFLKNVLMFFECALCVYMCNLYVVLFFFSKKKLLSHWLGDIITKRLCKVAYTQIKETPSDVEFKNMRLHT